MPRPKLDPKSPTRAVLLNLPEATIGKVKAEADRAGMTWSAWVRALIDRALARRKRQ